MSLTFSRVSQQVARYTPLGSNAECCGRCRFYMAPSSCGRIVGPVSPRGWCKYYSREMVQAYGGSIIAFGTQIPPGVTLDLNFMTPGTLDPRITFTRASTATYTDFNGVTQTAAVNAPRWDYTGGSLRGLLIEEARTNLCLQGSNIAASPWTAYSITVATPVVTANAIAAPDGTLSGTQLVFPAVSIPGTVSAWYQYLTMTQPVVFSVWLRGAVGGEQIYIEANESATFVNGGRLTLTTQWRRYTVNAPAPATGWSVIIGTDLRDTNQAATPAQTVYAWGGQLEVGAFATSYISTTAAAVTRATDSCVVPVANVTGFDATKGSLSHEYYMEGTAGNYSSVVQFVGANPNTDWINVAQVQPPPGAQPTLAANGIGVASTNVAYCNLPFVPLVTGVIHRSASAWLAGAPITGAHEGVGSTTGSGVASSLPVVTSLQIGGVANFQLQINQWARRTRYWPRQLSQAELISVTT